MRSLEIDPILQTKHLKIVDFYMLAVNNPFFRKGNSVSLFQQPLLKIQKSSFINCLFVQTREVKAKKERQMP